MLRSVLVFIGFAVAVVSCRRSYYGEIPGDARVPGGDVLATGGDGLEPGGDVLATGGDAPSDWWDVNYRQRHRLRFINAVRGEQLDLFTVLVRLDPAVFDTASMLPDRADVRFLDPDGTELVSESETVDLHWVLVPSIAASDADYIDMYFDGSGLGPSVSTSPWDSDYLSVWHLDSALKDSSDNNHDLAPVGAQFAPGWIGTGLATFADGSSYATAPAAPEFPALVEAVTACAWFSMTVVDVNFNAVLGRGRAATVNDPFYVGVANGLFYGEVVAESGTITRMPEAPAPPQTWIYGCTVFDGTDAMLFRDGVRVIVESVGQPLAADQLELGVGIDIEGGGTADHWEGFVDEVRISTVARSEAWISAEHASMTDALYVVEPVEILGP